MSDVITPDDLAARVAVLEQLIARVAAAPPPAPVPQAPPITIGPFANVPAPGSPIRSDWPQQITNYVYPAIPNLQAQAVGPLAWEMEDTVGGQGVTIGAWGNFAVGTFTVTIPGSFYVMIHAHYSTTAPANIGLHAAVGAQWVSGSPAGFAMQAGDAITLADSGIVDLAAGTHSVFAISQTSAGGVTIKQRSATVIQVRRAA